jgi:Tfp pilus assembly protein PilF
MDIKETRAVLAVASLVIATVAHVACGRSTARGEVRERAYRANNRGVAQLEQFKYREAADAFRDALRIDDSLTIAHVNLSLALLYAPDLAGARREAAEAARILPDAPQPAYILGLIARAENRTADALGAFERVRRIDAADVGTIVNLGQLRLMERQYAEAIAILQPAAQAEPYNVTVAYNLGLALTRNGQPEEGRQMLDRAQALRSTGYAVTFGTGYLEQGRYAEAIASTGAEPDLVDDAVPSAAFSSAAIGAPGGAPRAAISPLGRRYSISDLTPAGLEAIAAGLGGCVALGDIDNDGDLDLFVASGTTQRVWRHGGQHDWTDLTTDSRLAAPADSVAIGCVFGDYDNDGLVDLFVLRYGVSSLYHNDGGGRFRDVTAASGIPPYPFLPGAAAFVDVDHDGDLDLVIAGLADLAATRARAADRALTFPGDFAPAPIRLLRNNGNGTFTDATADAHLQRATHAIAVVPTDFDNRRDIDLLVVSRDDPPLLFQNLRDGTFRDVATEVGLAAAVGGAGAIAAVTIADVNKDDFPDVFFAGQDGGVFAMSDGHGHFKAAAAPDGARAGLAAQLFDYDNDGLVDLLTWSGDGAHVYRNLGQRWSDVSASAIPRDATGAALSSARGLAVADVNADGSTDLVTLGDAGLTLWRSSGSDGRRSLRVDLKGHVSNRLGVGSKIQLRAGSLSTRFERSAATPPAAPADIVFGLGRRPDADVLRVLWPSGVLQAEVREPGMPSRVTIEELDRKPSSCPFLYTWNGERFEFITDFMGGGEMGHWEGPGRHNTPQPVEYVRITGDQLRPKDGRFEVRVTNELEEALFADRFQLQAIAHPRDIEIYPSAGMTGPAKPFRLFAVAGARVPRAADDRGRDLTERIARIDRRYVDVPLEAIRGYAATHTLTLDLAPVGPAPILLLTAWTDYAFSSDVVAAHQAGVLLRPPLLQARDAAGRWRTIVKEIGIPTGRPQTVTVDLTGLLAPGEHEVRIVTNMRIYWDRIMVATIVTAEHLPIGRLDPIAAVLRARGFAAEVRPDGHQPPFYDYARVTLDSPWKGMPGRYTREGDVRELLVEADDKFVIAKAGDEIAMSFDAAAAGPLPDGWTRTFVLLSDGFSKEMDINSASPDRVEPLPFHAMTAYPYRAPEHYPDTPAYQQYQLTYNTRVVSRTVPSIDSIVSSPRRVKD